MSEFKEFQKIPRLYREVIVTEKIDGTNACVVVGEDGSVGAQSRSRIITTMEHDEAYEEDPRDDAMDTPTHLASTQAPPCVREAFTALDSYPLAAGPTQQSMGEGYAASVLMRRQAI